MVVNQPHEVVQRAQEQGLVSRATGAIQNAGSALGSVVRSLAQNHATDIVGTTVGGVVGALAFDGTRSMAAGLEAAEVAGSTAAWVAHSLTNKMDQEFHHNQVY